MAFEINQVCKLVTAFFIQISRKTKILILISIIGLFVLTRETLSLGTGTEIVPTIFITYIIFK